MRERLQLSLQVLPRLRLGARREALGGRRAREPGRGDGFEGAGLHVDMVSTESMRAKPRRASVSHLDLGDEVVCVLLRSAAVRLVDVLCDHAGV